MHRAMTKRTKRVGLLLGAAALVVAGLLYLNSRRPVPWVLAVESQPGDLVSLPGDVQLRDDMVSAQRLSNEGK